MSFREKCREISVICREIRVIGKSVGKPVSSAGKKCREISVIQEKV